MHTTHALCACTARWNIHPRLRAHGMYLLMFCFVFVLFFVISISPQEQISFDYYTHLAQPERVPRS